jgi:hypothetical protein
MAERTLDYNPLTGMRVSFNYDPVADSITLGHHQDAGAVIEDNKVALMDLDEHKRAAKNEWAHYAKIPEIVILEWKAKYGVDFHNPNHFKKCMALLNSSDYKYLKRTSYHHDR